MEVANRDQVGFTLATGARSGALAFGAMPIAAAVVGNAQVPAVLAAIDMAAECRRAAVLDRRDHIELGQAGMVGLDGTIAGAWARKMSATSIAVRESLQPPDPCLDRRRRTLERTVTERIVFVATRAVERGRIELGMPDSTSMTRMSTSCSSGCVAKLWRNVCGLTRLMQRLRCLMNRAVDLARRIGSKGFRQETTDPGAA